MADQNLEEELKHLENLPCGEVMNLLMFEMRWASSTIAGVTLLLQDFIDGKIDNNMEELRKLVEHQKNAVNKMVFIQGLYLTYRDRRFSDDSNQEVD